MFIRKKSIFMIKIIPFIKKIRTQKKMTAKVAGTQFQSNNNNNNL